MLRSRRIKIIIIIFLNFAWIIFFSEVKAPIIIYPLETPIADSKPLILSTSIDPPQSSRKRCSAGLPTDFHQSKKNRSFESNSPPATVSSRESGGYLTTTTDAKTADEFSIKAHQTSTSHSSMRADRENEPDAPTNNNANTITDIAENVNSPSKKYSDSNACDQLSNTSLHPQLPNDNFVDKISSQTQSSPQHILSLKTMNTKENKNRNDVLFTTSKHRSGEDIFSSDSGSNVGLLSCHVPYSEENALTTTSSINLSSTEVSPDVNDGPYIFVPSIQSSPWDNTEVFANDDPNSHISDQPSGTNHSENECSKTQQKSLDQSARCMKGIRYSKINVLCQLS